MKNKIKNNLRYIGVIIIITLIVISKIQYNNAVDTCIASGQNENICINGLK